MSYYDNAYARKKGIQLSSVITGQMETVKKSELIRCNSHVNDTYTAVQDNRKMFFVPPGNMDQVLLLEAKSPTEAKFYSFNLKNRMLIDDAIISVEVRPAGDSHVTADNIIIDDSGLGFSVRLNGGEVNQNIAVLFQVNTQKGELLDFVCTLPIRAQGLLAKEGDVIVVMGSPSMKNGRGIDAISMKDNQFLFQMSDGTTQEVSMETEGKVASLPSDFTLNGNIYTVPDIYVTRVKAMPEGLFLNGNLVLTDGSVIYRNTVNNGGLLCSA